MTLPPFSRKLMFITHITSSIGWFGAVAAFLALAIAGMSSQHVEIARSAYITMELIGWFVIVPFCIVSLLTGIVESWLTPWGFFRYYWIVVKLILTTVAAVILLVHMQPVSYISDIAKTTTFSNTEFHGLRIQLVTDAGAALLVLLIITTVSVYKPWGRTPFGVRKENERRKAHNVRSISIRTWGLYLLLTLIALVILLFIIMHLTGVLGRH